MSLEMTDHLYLGMFESAALQPTTSEKWINDVVCQVEAVFPGFNIDGSGNYENDEGYSDGYSIDEVYDWFDDGVSVEDAVKRLIAIIKEKGSYRGQGPLPVVLEPKPTEYSMLPSGATEKKQAS